MQDFSDPLSGALREINTTPLIDVLLVLLVMLIITIPAQAPRLHIQLPQNAAAAPRAASDPSPAEKPAVIRIVMDTRGVIHWNNEVLPNRAALDARLHALQSQLAAATSGTVSPQRPEIQLIPDKNTSFDTLAYVMAACQRHGFTKLAIQGLRRAQGLQELQGLRQNSSPILPKNAPQHP